MKKLSVVAIGLARSKKEKVLDVFYPLIEVKENINTSLAEAKFTRLKSENISDLEGVFETSLNDFATITSESQSYSETTVGFLYLNDL